ncbi:hypothetical protein F5Y18DRAFT_443622 [Xylariaceae sp. FL1019]|nr:hypothetical protein F5Y18DRAFT_443622 [Xylariaceae sp. FL1019]
MEKLEELAASNITQWIPSYDTVRVHPTTTDDNEIIDIFLKYGDELDRVEPQWVIKSLLKRGLPPATDEERSEILSNLERGYRNTYMGMPYELLDAELFLQIVLKRKADLLAFWESEPGAFQLCIKHLNCDISTSEDGCVPRCGGMPQNWAYMDMVHFLEGVYSCAGQLGSFNCNDYKAHGFKQCMTGHGFEAWATHRSQKMWEEWLTREVTNWYGESHGWQASAKMAFEIVKESIVWKPTYIGHKPHTTEVTMAHLARGKRKPDCLERIEVEFRTHLKPLAQVKEAIGKLLPSHHQG